MKITQSGLRYREYKEGCIEIFKPKSSKPSFYVTEEYLVDLFVKLFERYDDIEQLVEQSDLIKKSIK